MIHKEVYFHNMFNFSVVPMTNLMDTAKHLYLKEYRKYVKSGRLDKRFRQEGTFTLFAPQNQAFRELPPAKK